MRNHAWRIQQLAERCEDGGVAQNGQPLLDVFLTPAEGGSHNVSVPHQRPGSPQLILIVAIFIAQPLNLIVQARFCI
jgi:hypothetical protein